MLTHRMSGAPGGWNESDDDLSKRRRPLHASRWLRRELARSLGTSPDSRALAAYVALNLAQSTVQLAWASPPPASASSPRRSTSSSAASSSPPVCTRCATPARPRRAPHLRRKQTPRPRRVRQRVFPRLRRTLTRRRGSARAHRTRPGSPHGRPPRRTPQLRRRRLRRRFLPPAPSTSTSASSSTPSTRAPEDVLMRGVLLHAVSQAVRSSRVVLALVLRRVRVRNPEALACVSPPGGSSRRRAFPSRRRARVLSQAPPDDSRAALAACRAETSALPGVLACEDVRVWEMAPGEAVGTVALRVERGANRDAVARRRRGERTREDWGRARTSPWSSGEMMGGGGERRRESGGS